MHIRPIALLLCLLAFAGCESKAPDSSHPVPAQQERLISIIETFADKYSKQPNELKKSGVRMERQAALAEAFAETSFSGWIGTLEDMDTDGDGVAEIAVRLQGSKITLSNTTSGLSFGEAVFGDTDSLKIQPDTPLWNAISSLSKGDVVEISGELLTEDGGKDYLALVGGFEWMSMNQIATISTRFTGISKK